MAPAHSSFPVGIYLPIYLIYVVVLRRQSHVVSGILIQSHIVHFSEAENPFSTVYLYFSGQLGCIVPAFQHDPRRL